MRDAAVVSSDFIGKPISPRMESVHRKEQHDIVLVCAGVALALGGGQPSPKALVGVADLRDFVIYVGSPLNGLARPFPRGLSPAGDRIDRRSVARNR